MIALQFALQGSAYALSLHGNPAVQLPIAQNAAVRTATDFIRMEAATPSQEECTVVPAAKTEDCDGPLSRKPPFNKVMAANRAEIAVRIMRACTELNMETVAIYGNEDRYSQHRWGADQSFMLDKEAAASPISAYLDIDQIIGIAKENGVCLGAEHKLLCFANFCLGADCCQKFLSEITNFCCKNSQSEAPCTATATTT